MNSESRTFESSQGSLECSRSLAMSFIRTTAISEIATWLSHLTIMMRANVSVDFRLGMYWMLYLSNSFNYDNRFLKVRCHCYLHLKGEKKEITFSVVPGCKWQIRTMATWPQGESVLLASTRRWWLAAEVCLMAIFMGRHHEGRPVCKSGPSLQQ